MQTQTDGFSFQLSCMFISLQSFFLSLTCLSFTKHHSLRVNYISGTKKEKETFANSNKICCFSLFFSLWASQRSNSFIPFFVCTIIKPQQLGFVDVVSFRNFCPVQWMWHTFLTIPCKIPWRLWCVLVLRRRNKKIANISFQKFDTILRYTSYVLRECRTYETMHIPHKTQFSFENIFQFSAVHQICLFCIQNTLALNARNSIVYYVSFPMEFFNEFQFSKNNNNRHEQFAVHFASLLRANIEHTFWDLINIQQCSWSVVRYGYI